MLAASCRCGWPSRCRRRCTTSAPASNAGSPTTVRGSGAPEPAVACPGARGSAGRDGRRGEHAGRDGSPRARVSGWWCRSRGSGALGRGVERVERLAARHEQPVALGPAEADVAAHLGQPDAPDELALGRPDRHAAVANRPPGVAGGPDVAVHVAPDAVGSALDAIDHEVAEHLAVGRLVVGADVEDVHVALAARAGIAGPLAGAHDVELLVVWREAK